MTATTALDRFTVGSCEDLLALIPYLIGYEPDEALLVMTCLLYTSDAADD